MSIAFRAVTVASRAKSASTSRLAAMRLRMTALSAKMSCTFSVPAVIVPSMIFSPAVDAPVGHVVVGDLLKRRDHLPPSSTDTE